MVPGTYYGVYYDTYIYISIYIYWNMLDSPGSPRYIIPGQTDSLLNERT